MTVEHLLRFLKKHAVKVVSPIYGGSVKLQICISSLPLEA